MKRRAFAIGIVAAGSSLGGVIFPIMLDHLIPEVGYGWALRVSAFLILALLIIGNLTVKSRFPPSPKPLRLYQYFKPLTETPYLLTTIASFLFYLGLFLPINYIQVQSTEYGMSKNLASYMIPILNAARYILPSLPVLFQLTASKFVRPYSSRLDWGQGGPLQHPNRHVLSLGCCRTRSVAPGQGKHSFDCLRCTLRSWIRGFCLFASCHDRSDLGYQGDWASSGD